MNLDLNRMTEKLKQNDFIKYFLKELSEALDSFNNYKTKGEKMDDIILTPKEDLEFYRKESDFLQNYFKKELSDSSKGELYIVSDKFENDNEYHRYKVAQYKNNLEYKYVTFEKDLPENVQVGDIVRKIDGKYTYDKEATQFVKEIRDRIKQEIIKKR